MAATVQYHDSADLKAALSAPGLIREDVMEKIWNISRVPLPFTERVGSVGVTNAYHEWTRDQQATPNIANRVVSGADATGNNTAVGDRVGNHCQNSVKVVEVSERAQDSKVIGRDNEFSYQLMMRQQDLRRDVEATVLAPQASVQDNGDAIAGQVGTLPSWIVTNRFAGAGGTVGGFNSATKLVAAPGAGASRVMTDTLLTSAIEAAYLQNGDLTVAMSVPQLIARIARYQFTAGAHVAVPTANVQGSGGKVEQTAQGFINVLVTDYGTTLSLVPNRLQQTYQSTDGAPVPVCDLFLLDMSVLDMVFLKNYVTRPLAKLGLADRSQISVDWSLRVGNEKACAIVRDLLPLGVVIA